MRPDDGAAGRFAAIANSSNDAIIGKTLDGVITSWNRAAERMFGYTAAEAVGKPITLIIPEDSRKEEDEVLARIRRGEGEEHFEALRVAKNGQRLNVSLTVAPIKNAAGQVVGALKIARDITDRKRAAEALLHSETQAGAILEAVSEGIVIIDQRGTIVSVNRRAEDMFGYPREGLLDRPLEMLLPERLRSGHSEHRASYFQDPRSRPMGQGLDLLACRSDGTEFPVEISLSYVETENGLRGLAFVTDITQRQSMERATRQAERLAALGRLSAGIAHELNNPIGIISSRIEIMLLDAEAQPLPPEVMEDLKVLHRNAQRVARIAQGLLSFARQSSGERAPVDLNHLVEETLSLIEKQFVASGITIERGLAPVLPPVLGDSNALQQVVLNLLTNARDALESGGAIAVETKAVPGRPGGARLTVRDTGTGIPPEILPRIFDPFFTTKSDGTGLGLSISYGIVRDHQGTVDVQSRPGQGTTFVLTFPAIAEDRRP
jgi:PAS domain S-box-containing protein